MLYYNELNDFFLILEKKIFENNGIIYDEYVCNKLLANYYKNIYYKNNLPINKFYDIEYNNETKDRFIKSTIMKINFKSNNDYIQVCTFINDNKNTIDKLNISLEISISTDEPPFKTNNYICYGLLLCNNYYYSSNTGTPYDLITDKLKLKFKIINDILKKQTQFIRGFYSNYEIFSDICRMTDNGWKITNLPYIILDEIKTDKLCPICLNKLNTEETIEIFNYNIHHLCIKKYFLSQKNALIFKCPYRNMIDLNICKYLIDYEEI